MQVLSEIQRPAGDTLGDWHPGVSREPFCAALGALTPRSTATYHVYRVQSGGALVMWQKYFGDRLEYYGVDINPYCKVCDADQALQGFEPSPSAASCVS